MVCQNPCSADAQGSLDALQTLRRDERNAYFRHKKLDILAFQLHSTLFCGLSSTYLQTWV